MSSNPRDLTSAAHGPQAGAAHHPGHPPGDPGTGPTAGPGPTAGTAGAHQHPGGLRGLLAGLFRPHSHDPAGQAGPALAASTEGMRALKISLAGLAATAAAQLAVVLVSGSVALLADTIHNVADALTALPIGIAFLAARRPATRRYTYGYGRSEDIAGLFVLLAMTASSALAAYEAISRLVHPRGLHGLAWVAAAGMAGFVGNELVAGYRIRAGRRIGSAALVADGLHARTDGLTSLAVVAGAAGVAAGWPPADPVAGILISIAVFGVLRQAAREVYGRIMDRVDHTIVSNAERVIRQVRGVSSLDRLRMRWVGHDLLAEIDISADPALTLPQAHEITEAVRHQLLQAVHRLTDATIHISPLPGPAAGDPHPHRG